MKFNAGSSIPRLAVAIACSLAFVSVARAQSASESFVLFKTKCASCHTFGKGIRVGPDLQGVTTRHTRDWLVKWIRSPETLVRANDPVAVKLFRQFKGQRMPDHELSDPQIHALLDYLAADGPLLDQQKRIREARTATAGEIALGRRLFYGEVRLASGALACAACHSVQERGALGGSLAGDLTYIHTRFQDKALDRHLKQPCFPRAPALSAERAGERESLALRGFLRAVGANARQGGTGDPTASPGTPQP